MSRRVAMIHASTRRSGRPTSWIQRGTSRRGGRAGALTQPDATASVVGLRPPDWDWSFAVDGALALDRALHWDEAPETRRGGLARGLG